MFMKFTPSKYRRSFVLGLAGFGLYSQTSEALDLDGSGAKLSEEDITLKRKFRGMQGGQLVVDAFGEKEGVNIFDETGKLFFKSASVSAKNNSKYSYSANFGVPKILRAEWRDPAVEYGENALTGAYDEGVVIASYTVPVASRIPEVVLKGQRDKVGGFRLKIRLHDDGLLIGWDLSRGFNLQYLAGGDFREADRENGKVLRKGWYIHPKTGVKYGTNF
jgi:hypothetical protein